MKIYIHRLYIKLLLLNGLIVALIKFVGISIPTSPNVIITFLFLSFFISFLIKSKNSNIKKIIFLYLFYVLIKFIVFKYFNFRDAFNVIQDMLAFATFYFFYNLSKEAKIKCLYIFRNFILFFITIFFIKYFFKDYLPSAFEEVPNLFLPVDDTQYIRVIDGVSFYRPNGLIGNPITFGFLLNLLLATEIFFLKFKKPKLINFIIIFILSIMIFILLSRANITLCLMLLSSIFLKRKNIIKSISILLISLIILIPLSNLLYTKSSQVKFVIDRFTGDDDYASQSTAEHLIDYIKAYEMFKNNPIVGVSAKRILEEEIITDGAIPILILRNGLFGFLILLLMYFFIMKKYNYQSKKLEITTSFFIFSLVFFPLSILNSAILDKGIYLIIFIWFGLTCNILNRRLT